MSCEQQPAAEASNRQEGRLPWEPTPEEIERECAAMQATWSQARLATRAGLAAWRIQSPHSPFHADGRPLRIE